jgi:hypothetical protein
MTIAILHPDDSGNAVFAVRLKSVPILPTHLRAEPENFGLRLLGRHMDLIHALHDPRFDLAVELRYLFDPIRPYAVEVYFLIRTRTPEAAAVFASDFLGLLHAHFDLHRFRPVEDEAETARLLAPFAPEDIVEILRREDRVPLDSLRRTSAGRLGFNPPEIPEDPDAAESGRVYVAFPFSLHLDPFARLCAVLLLQDRPALVSIGLRPYRLTPEDEEFLARRVRRCEKFAQLSIRASDDVARLKPFLKRQAENLHHRCVRDFVHLQDAALLQKIQVLSPGRVSADLVATLGACITEHAGHPHAPLLEKSDQLFAGGYEWRRPENEAARNIALRNYRDMAFDAWAPTVAPEGFAHLPYLFDVSQAAAGFRLPFPVGSEFPGIETVQYSHRVAPSDLPVRGVVLGDHPLAHRGRSVRFPTEDRLRHAYVVGQTGTGKSTFFRNLIMQDIREGRGVALIDPHGELIEELLPRIPRERLDDVVYVNPADFERPVGINLLEYDSPYEKDFCVNYLIEVFDILYDMNQSGGPMFEMYMRNTLYLLMEQPGVQGRGAAEGGEGEIVFLPTVMDVPRLFQDKSVRDRLLKNCLNPYVRDFWEKEAGKADGDLLLRNIAPYITSKINRFLYNETLRTILGQRRSTVDFRAAMDESRILLVDLRKGLLGATNSHFLGMLVVGKLLAAILSRTGAEDRTKLPPFFLYVDEFQNLATPAFVSMFSEARKYGLGLMVANQYIGQLRQDILCGVLGNVGTLVSFRVGSVDAEVLGKEFGEIVSKSDIMGLPNWHAYVRLLNGGDVSSPFTLRTRPPVGVPVPGAAEEVRRRSRLRYGRPVESVEAEIRNPFMRRRKAEPVPEKEDDIDRVMEELRETVEPNP